RLFRDLYTDVADELGVEYRHNWGGSSEHASELVTIGYTPDQKGAQDCYRYEKAVCPEPFYVLTVKANGDVCCCCLDWNGQLKVGSLIDNNLEEIWQGEPLREIQLKHLRRERSTLNSCRDCSMIG